MLLVLEHGARRWTIVTDEQRLARKEASSMAVPPPPTTTTGLSLKKNPSHTAHAETPLFWRRSSFGRPRYFAFAPVARVRARPWDSASPTQTLFGFEASSTAE